MLIFILEIHCMLIMRCLGRVSRLIGSKIGNNKGDGCKLQILDI